ncbi:MAG: hypothetical protein WCC22_05690 [Terriglobales bacterium]
MKNWAMTVVAAVISGLAFGAKAGDYPTPPMYAGAVIVYVLVLRFYVRAILCYTNLVRWNILQSDCIQLKLIPRLKETAPSKTELKKKLASDIQDYYHEWLSPLSRKDQLSQNLKLAFYPLFAFTIFFVAWGGTRLWHDQFVKGLTVFAILTTVLEAADFFRSKYFDDPAARERKKQKKSRIAEVFPVPQSGGGYLVGWILNVAISLIVANWPAIKQTLVNFFS